MIATIINCVTVIVGTAIGVLFHARIKESFRSIVFTGIGLISLIIGIKMSLATTMILAAAFALVFGGLIGHALRIEDAMLAFGDRLGRRFGGKSGVSEFAHGFLTATVLFCVGAMTIVGSLKAGVSGDYELLLTKSAMDGFMSIMLSASMGVGVGFSALVILVYQGGLTLLATVIEPLLSPLALSELEGVGGMLVVMIGLNLLSLKSIKTANFIPALVFALLFAVLAPLVKPLLAGIGM